MINCESTLRYNGGKKKKKNGAHTHVRTTVQLDERNIHVGCCLFSHKNNNKNQNNKSVIFMLKALGCFGQCADR